MSAFATTSVPEWAVAGAADAVPDPAARAWLVVGLGAEGSALAGAWVPPPGPARPHRVVGDSSDQVSLDVAAALAGAVVGIRVLAFGPVGDCLRLRAQLLDLGLEDDEVTFVSTGQGHVDVYCSHCQQVTRAAVGIGATVPCTSCGLSLLVYHHVARTTGRFLGFQVDAETLPGAASTSGGAA